MKFWNTKKKSNWMCNKPMSPSRGEETSQDTMGGPVSVEKCTSSERNTNDVVQFCHNTTFNSNEELLSVLPREENASDFNSSNDTKTPSISNTDYDGDSDFILSDKSTSSASVSSNDVDENFTDGETKNERMNLDERSIEKSQTAAEETLCNEVERVSRKNYKDRVDFCIFCEKDVSHFARHLMTWHEIEFEVQKIMAQNPNSKKRRELLCLLRKRGNFIRNRTQTKIRPVKRLQHTETSKSESFLPCKYCFGFYKRKCLARHTKLCLLNNELTTKKQTSQSDGQTTLLMNTLLKHDELLREKVFPRMRADEISGIAKQDALICFYGYSYLKGRKSKGNLDIVRQNMRNLAKLLKFSRTENSEVKTLMDLLKPNLFQLIVKAVNIMARFNLETERYESPTLAMNFGTLIKKCCDLAFIHLIQQKNDTTAQREEMNTLKVLVQSQWADEVSAHASSNLSENKWNKDELLPLTSDLKKFNSSLVLQANESFSILKLNKNNQSAYIILKETLYAQIILLNRRRPAEVAQLKVHTFKAINFDEKIEDDNELQNCLTETEKILMKTFTRIVIRGKRGRGVPILLSPEMKAQFDLILETRDNFVNGNEYIFHTNGMGFIDGTKILHKYAAKCGLQKAKSITATRLRKHLATITQLLQLSNNDMEQLAKFMGHTLKTHCSVYRMSDNMYQTAKVSKLLLLMTKGGVEQFKGKNLDQIDIDMNPVYDDGDVVEEMVSQSSNLYDCIEQPSTSQASMMVTKKKPKTQKIMARENWSINERNIVAHYFRDNIKQKHAPKKIDIDKFLTLHFEQFGRRKWTSIKAMVYNMYCGKLKFDK